MIKKNIKQFNVNITVGKDADMGKAIREIHTALNKAKTGDIVVVNLNGAPLNAVPDSDGSELL